MAALYDGDQNQVFQIDGSSTKKDSSNKDNNKKEVGIPESQRTEDGNSAKEQLASILPKGADTKGYTLTQYVNDVNRENSEVLMEYSADDKVRQAYTYGETRLSVDKAEETSYYLNEGRGIVTGLLTETGRGLDRNMINDQWNKVIAQKPFGLLGNVGNNGCSVIAIYNANKILGIDTSFDEILDDFNGYETKHPAPTVAGGLLGGNPFYVQKYYEKKGYTAAWKSKSDVSKDADAYIALQFYKLRAHYQAGEYYGGQFHVYNPKQDFDDINEMNKKNNNFYTKVLEIRKK